MTATPSPSTRADSQQTKARTAGPWILAEATVITSIGGANQIAIFGYGKFKTADEAAANAAFVVQACNAHDDLVAALEDSWKLIAELEDAVDKGLKLLPHDTARITACCEAACAALVLANHKPSGAQT